jgi:hypothetical protein
MQMTTEITPFCEICEKERATSFSHFDSPGRNLKGWKYCCNCTSEYEHYPIEFSRFFGNDTEIVDWLAHMHEKGWMDWKDFMDMIHRFRSEMFARIGEHKKK